MAYLSGMSKLRTILRRISWPAAPLAVAITYSLPNRIGWTLGTLLLLSVIISLWQTLIAGGWTQLGKNLCFATIVLTLVTVVVAFGHTYYALLLWSDYPTQHFRLAPSSRIGTALAKMSARDYLHSKRTAYTAMYRDSAALNKALSQEKLSWKVKAHFMSRFAGPVPELSEEPNPVAFERFIHELALEQEEIYRFYKGDVAERLSYSGRLIESETVEVLADTAFEINADFQASNLASIMFIDLILAYLGSVDVPEQRELYVAALLFSTLHFMTAGYADMVPNSTIAMGLLGLQFVVYVAVFLLLIPLAWPPSDKGKESTR